MSLKYRNASGVETPIAGLNGTSGELVPSATYVQSGNLTCKVPAVGTYSTFNVTFTTPMPDTDYEVNLSHTFICDYFYKNKTVNGFAIIAQNAWSENAGQNDIVYWTAYKLTTNEDRELDEQAIADLQAVVPSDASASNKLVTYDSKIRGLVTGNWITTSFDDAIPSDNSSMQIFTVLNSATHTPALGANYMVIAQAFDANNIQQEAIQNTTNNRYIRYYNGSLWSSWQKLVTESDITPTQIASYTKAGGGAFNLKVYKSGGMKYINITGDSTAQTLTNGELYTLTDAAVPTIAVTFPCYYVQVGVASKVGFIFIGTNGKVQLRDTDYEVVNANVTYIRGQGWYY